VVTGSWSLWVAADVENRGRVALEGSEELGSEIVAGGEAEGEFRRRLRGRAFEGAVRGENSGIAVDLLGTVDPGSDPEISVGVTTCDTEVGANEFRGCEETEGAAKLGIVAGVDGEGGATTVDWAGEVDVEGMNSREDGGGLGHLRGEAREERGSKTEQGSKPCCKNSAPGSPLKIRRRPW